MTTCLSSKICQTLFIHKFMVLWFLLSCSQIFACFDFSFHDKVITKLTQCHKFSDTSSQHPVVKNKQETIFSDFSVTTRAVIGSCLQAIECLETKPQVSSSLGRKFGTTSFVDYNTN